MGVKMEAIKESADMKEIETVRYVELPGGKKYGLRKFSMSIEIKLKSRFGSAEKWHQDLVASDPEAIIYALWLLLDDAGQKDFHTWEDLANAVPADGFTKLAMITAIGGQVASGQPQIVKAMDERLKKAQAQLREVITAKMNEAATVQ